MMKICVCVNVLVHKRKNMFVKTKESDFEGKALPVLAQKLEQIAVDVNKKMTIS